MKSFISKVFGPTEISFFEKILIHALVLHAIVPAEFYTWVGL